MHADPTNPAPPSGALRRRFGLKEATALNMTNMIGVGPFITIPLLMTAMGGPQALLGWLVALCIVIPDGLVWAELGAAMPGSGPIRFNPLDVRCSATLLSSCRSRVR